MWYQVYIFRKFTIIKIVLIQQQNNYCWIKQYFWSLYEIEIYLLNKLQISRT